MKTKELIEALSKLDPEKEVKAFDWTFGESPTDIERIEFSPSDDVNIIFIEN